MRMSFDNVKGRLGFGCMRLPMKDGEVDTVEFSRMIDRFMAEGFNYFDTARGYLDGKSETALAECLAARYPRESFVLVNKLSDWCFEKNADIRPFFESQLRACGVEYFDFYLMHAQNKHNYKKYKREGAYEEAFKLKAEGKVRHVGLSFHDTADVLDMILTDYPDIELVQIQLNYYDYLDSLVQSRACYDVCMKHGKPVAVMEPVKGGTLATLTPAARCVVEELGGSPASLAIRFAASLEGVFITLSGMGNMDMINENTSFMKDFKPVTEHEREVLFRTAQTMREDNLIACTACRYCVSGCPSGILIPDLFACLNDNVKFENWQGGYFYQNITKDTGKASACVGCGACEESCPQRLPIRELLVRVKDTFEK